MKLLVFDTSLSTVSVALVENGVACAQTLIAPSEGNRQESITLLVPAIEKLVASLNWKPEDLDLIVVGTGPGSFTGLRIGVVTARTLAQALSIGLIGVNSFDSLASQVKSPCGFVLDGGRGHYFVSAPNIEPCVLNESQLNELVSQNKINWYHFQGAPFNDLPKVQNMALCQAMFVLQDETLKKSTRAELLSKFPYNSVKPLYLREASVTLKKNPNPTHVRKS